MRAFALKEFDRAPTLCDLPAPRPGVGDVLIRIIGSSVNPYDMMAGRGVFRGLSEYRLPAILGRDFVGEVREVGRNVGRFRPGDAVMGMVKRDYIGDGTFAEFVVVPEDRFIIPRPTDLSVIDAGCLGLAGVTALQCLMEVDRREGETIFINGATGGVGAFAIQLARARGLHVVATAAPGEEAERIMQLGANRTVDRGHNAIEQVREMFPNGVDGVIDLISRDSASFSRTAELARLGGSAVSTLSAARDGAGAGRTTANVHSSGDPKLLEQVAAVAAAGLLRVPFVEVFPLAQIEDAFALLAAGSRGKIALSVE